jgi:hypothetical protein
MRSRAALIIVLACLAAACGGDDGNGVTGPSNSPFTQTVTGTVSTFGWTRHPLTTTRAGQLTVRLTWTNGGPISTCISRPRAALTRTRQVARSWRGRTRAVAPRSRCSER